MKSNVKTFIRDKVSAYPRLDGMLRQVAYSVGRGQGNYPRMLGREIAAVARVLRTSNWNMNYGGDLVHRTLEEEFAAYVGTRCAVAANTGGMALQIILRAIGIKPGDEVIHQVDTCVADAFAVMAAGGTPIFADTNCDNFMLSQQSVADAVSDRTRALIPIHMWGNPEAMDWISEFSKRQGLFVIEDSCLSLGAIWKGRPVGSFGDAAIFSLGCLKPIQAGEGGIVTTNDEALAKELRTIRNWGDMSEEYGIRDQQTLSWNGRISEIVAAVALEQLRGYPRYLENLRAIVQDFFRALKRFDEVEIVVPDKADVHPAYSQVVVRLKRNSRVSKSELMANLRAEGVNVWHANFEPINQLSFFKKGKWRDWILRGDLNRVERNYAGPFPNSEAVYADLGMGFSRENFSSPERVKRVVQSLERIFRQNGS
jgi:dTDP-4-amino-4,6-dideoxygalactose transaminase